MRALDIFSRGKSDSIRELPYVIAEAGVNHEGSMEIAQRLIEEAAEGGANAIKFQTYKAGTLASKNSPAYWDTTKEKTQSQYELFKKHDSFWKKEFEQLKLNCDKSGIEFLSTPFDTESALFLNDLMDVFKISSSDLTNKPFVEYICGFGKPVLLSTGASYLYEIHEAVSWMQKTAIPHALLHCVLSYPNSDENACLGMISALKSSFPQHIIGYSDHTEPKDMSICQTAWLLGAQVVEKHFTHDKTLRGNDHYHAMDKDDLAYYLKCMKKTLSTIGEVTVSVSESEISARKHARRSLVAKRKILSGQKINADDLISKRPGSGISPRLIDEILGKFASEDIDEDEVLMWKHVF